MGFFETIAGPALEIANTLIGVHAAKKENARERDFNADQAQLNREFQREERLATQEYNSASAQIQRMMDAGINPIAGIGNGYTSATSSPMSGSQASYSSSLGSSILTAASQMALNIATTEKLQSETENVEHRTINDDKRTIAEIDKIMSDIGFQSHTKDLQNLMYNLSKTRNEAEIKVIQEQLNKLRNESLEILKGIELTDTNIKRLFSDIKVNEANIKKIKQDTSTSQAQEYKTYQDIAIGQEEQKTELYNSEIKRVIAEWSTTSGIPVGATGSEAAFVLWANGKFDECFDKLTLDDYYSNSVVKYGSATRDLKRRYKKRTGRPFGYRNYDLNDYSGRGQSIYTK